MSLSLAIDWFERVWAEFKASEDQNEDGIPYTIDKELEETPLLVNRIIDEFVREEDYHFKRILASLIVYHTPYTPAIEWLRDNSDWTKEDFAEFGINIDDYKD